MLFQDMKIQTARFAKSLLCTYKSTRYYKPETTSRPGETLMLHREKGKSRKGNENKQRKTGRTKERTNKKVRKERREQRIKQRREEVWKWKKKVKEMQKI